MTITNIALVIPAFNEASTIRGLAQKARAMTPNVIIVNDGSSDDTAAQLHDIDVQLINLPANQGKAAALICGFQAVLQDDRVEGVVTLDGDGQHRIEDLQMIVDAGQSMPDTIIIGSRLWDTEKFPKARLRANKFANFWISWAAGYRIDDSQSGFRYYPASLLRNVDLHALAGRGFVFESEILILAARKGVHANSVRIPALYNAQTFRPSHFQQVADIAKIVRMVSWKLISRGMNPCGLWRYLRQER